MRTFQRTDRVNRLLRDTLSELLLLSVRDPRVQDVVITRVQVTADLSLCRVYVRTLCEGDQRDRVLAGLDACAGFLRREVGKRVRLLRVPAFRFFYDDLPDQVAAVGRLLDEIRREQGPS